MTFESKALPEFWDHYHDLPDDIQRRADKQFAFLIENPRHPSLTIETRWRVLLGSRHRRLSRSCGPGGKRLDVVLDRATRRIRTDSEGVSLQADSAAEIRYKFSNSGRFTLVL